MNQPQLSASLISNAVGLAAPKQNIIFGALSSDTRTIKQGDCFIALKGEQIDGHSYIAKAVQAGATAVIHEKNFALPAGTLGFAVDDTLAAYRQIAKAWRQEFKIPVVAIAGSAGKTTTKELVAAVLRGKWRHVLQTQASQNGFTGIPATLMNLAPRHDIAVVEVGIDEPGAMVQHLDIVKPTLGILTSIGEEHLEKLHNLATVAKEEGELFRHLAEHEVGLCINADDNAVLSQSQLYPGGKRLYYSLEQTAPTHYLRGQISSDQQTLTISELGDFALPLPGRHNASNVLGALAIGHALGLTPQELRAGLQSFQSPSGRSELHIWKHSIRVYCDTYNANPLSVKTALQLLEKTPEAQARHSRTWACLGDMLELGDQEEALHRGLAETLTECKVDFVLLLGPKMKFLESELRQQKFAGFVQHFENTEAMKTKILAEAKANDLILIKGSRGMRMETLWQSLQSAT